MDAVYGSPEDYYNDHQDDNYGQISEGLRRQPSYSPISQEGVSPIRAYMDHTVKHR